MFKTEGNPGEVQNTAAKLGKQENNSVRRITGRDKADHTDAQGRLGK